MVGMHSHDFGIAELPPYHSIAKFYIYLCLPQVTSDVEACPQTPFPLVLQY